MSRSIRTAALWAAGALMLSACAAEQADPQSGPELPTVTSDSSGQQTPEETPPEETPPAQDVSPRGNAIAAIGQEIPLAVEGDTVTATATVDAITVDPPCLDDYDGPSQPENGHFVRMDVRAATQSADPAGPGEYTARPSLNENSFTFVGPDGLTYNGSLATYSAFTCLPDEERLPSEFGPGQQFAGALVLDVPAPSGTLVFSSFMGGSGWEWNF